MPADPQNVRILSSSLRLDKPGADWPAPPAGTRWDDRAVTAMDPNGDDDE